MLKINKKENCAFKISRIWKCSNSHKKKRPNLDQKNFLGSTIIRNQQKGGNEKESNLPKPLPSFSFFRSFLLVSYNRWSYETFSVQIWSFFFFFCFLKFWTVLNFRNFEFISFLLVYFYREKIYRPQIKEERKKMATFQNPFLLFRSFALFVLCCDVCSKDKKGRKKEKEGRVFWEGCLLFSFSLSLSFILRNFFVPNLVVFLYFESSNSFEFLKFWIILLLGCWDEFVFLVIRVQM